MKSLLALCAIGLLGVGASSCADAHKNTSPATATTAAGASAPQETKADPDKDNDGLHGAPDGDTIDSLLSYGRPADSSDRRTISALIKRYYTIAVAAEGAKACSMIYSTFAESVPENYGTSPPGPPYARGSTCPVVLTKVYKHYHTWLAVKLAKLDVAHVRVKGHLGLAVLHFGTMPEREMRVVREGHTWRIEGILDGEIP